MGGKFIIACISLVLFMVLAGGCGNKGPLTLPDTGAGVVPAQSGSPY